MTFFKMTFFRKIIFWTVFGHFLDLAHCAELFGCSFLTNKAREVKLGMHPLCPKGFFMSKKIKVT